MKVMPFFGKSARGPDCGRYERQLAASSVARAGGARRTVDAHRLLKGGDVLGRDGHLLRRLLEGDVGSGGGHLRREDAGRQL
jgi:hypothetical protein